MAVSFGKKLTALFLALVMLCSVMPVFAAETADIAEITTTEEKTKNIIATEDFVSPINDWQFNTKNDFYVLNERLNIKLDNVAEGKKTAFSDAIAISNGELEFMLNPIKGNYVSVLLRYVDQNSYYTLRFYQSGQVALMKKVKGGSLKKIAEGDSDLAKGKENRIHISIIRDNFTVSVNGDVVLEKEDSSIKSGKFGFSGNNCTAYIDDIEYYKYSGVEYDGLSVEEEASKKKIYVAVDGNDETGDGSEEKPYATLGAAREAAARAKKGRKAVDVIFKEGTYRLNESFDFNKNDSGSEGAPIRYMAEEGANVTISGAKEVDVTKFEPVSGEILERIKPTVHDKVLQIDLAKQGFDSSYNFAAEGTYTKKSRIKPLIMTLNKSMQNLARWPDTEYAVIKDADNSGNGKILYTENAPTRWANATEMFIDGFLYHEWSPEWVKVENVDVLTNSINFRHATSYGVKVDGKWAAVNLVEELDIPGEYFIDFNTMTMYYYPPHELTENDMMEIAHVSHRLIRLNDVSNVTFENLHFTMTRGNAGSGIYTTTGCSDITIKNCTVDNVTRYGMELNGKNITVEGCTITNCGESGINVDTAGDINTLESSNVVIKNNDISLCALFSGHNNNGGVIIGDKSVGVTIINNVIHNIINSAVRYRGVGHRIAYNEIYNCVNEAADAGAIYTGRSWMWYGTVVEYNFFHDIGPKWGKSLSAYGASAMFWDDINSGNEYSHNIAVMNYKTKTNSVVVGGGTDNVVKGNTSVASLNGINANQRTTTADWIAESSKTYKYNESLAKSTVYATAYPKMASILDRIRENGGALKRENVITDNLSVDCTTDNKITDAMLTDGFIENNVGLGADRYDIFVDPENLDYRVKKEAKALYGISDEILDEDFDLDSIGLEGEHEMDMDRMKFTATHPENGAENVAREKVVIAWTKPSMADTFTYIVATDPELNNVVATHETIKTTADIEGLEKGKTYYWKVIAHNKSREYGCDVEATNGVMSFTTATKSVINTDGLALSIKNAEALVKTFKEGNEPGLYRPGSVKDLNSRIKKAKTYLTMNVEEQSEIDNVTYELNRALTSLDGFVNTGYTTLDIGADSEWIANNENNVKLTPGEGSLKMELKGMTEISLNETLSNYNVMCFKTKIDHFNNESWFAYGLRAQDTGAALYQQEAYYFLIKEDIIELQKRGKIFKTAPNDGKFVAGKWHEVEFGSVTTENGINLYFKLDGEVIFDYLDQSAPQKRPGMFAMFHSTSDNVVEIQKSDNVPTGLYEFSNAILAQINNDPSVGGTQTVADDSFTEKGEWTDRTDVVGADNVTVRTSSAPTANATWDLNTGTQGNNKVYKLSYYHVPSANGDKNVTVTITSYQGEYKTTIDLSSGEAGWVELGTFSFMSADYVGRAEVKFASSGEGELNLSNIKYELSPDSKDMLK